MSLLERARAADAVQLSFDDTASDTRLVRRPIAPGVLRTLVRCNREGEWRPRGAASRLAHSLRARVGERAAMLRTKRVADFVAALAGLLLLAPVLIATAVAIRLTTPGPALFKQWRHGLNGVPFEVYKFRTFYADRSDSSGVTQTVKNDARVTPLGRLLRKTNIDELPQLLNVLKGEMSIVGPRPHPIGMKAGGVKYEELVTAYPLRHLVTPGLTGLAQVRGFRGPTTDRFAARGRVLNDLLYVERQTLLLDLAIVWRTIIQEIRRASGS